MNISCEFDCIEFPPLVEEDGFEENMFSCVGILKECMQGWNRV